MENTLKNQRRHINIPVFIPHEGCPNNCVFCNQHTITGAENASASRDIRPEIDACLATIDRKTSDCEIAFFGGSFTGIDRNDMIRLLSVAKEYLDAGLVESIRLSTRPDFISEEILDILEYYGVKNIELGIQSTDDKVLAASKRGHTAECTRNACRMIKERGFSLTGQMMVGLPGATPESEVATAAEICQLGAESARIYPAVVFYDTELCSMAKSGSYVPLDNESAVERCAKVYKVFAENGVNLLRIGLQSGEGLSEDKVYAGASHSAIGEMVIGAYYFDLLCEKSRILLENGTVKKGDRILLTVFCACGEVSKVAGQKRVNKDKITEYFTKAGVNLACIKIKEKQEMTKNRIDISVEILSKAR